LQRKDSGASAFVEAKKRGGILILRSFSKGGNTLGPEEKAGEASERIGKGGGKVALVKARASSWEVMEKKVDREAFRGEKGT